MHSADGILLLHDVDATPFHDVQSCDDKGSAVAEDDAAEETIGLEDW